MPIKRFVRFVSPLAALVVSLVYRFRFSVSVVMGLAVGSFTSAVVRADIVGFGDFSGFAVNQYDAGALPDILPNEIHLINHSMNESRSIFYEQPQGVGAFSASFQYRASGPLGDGRFGAALVLQNSPLGPQAVAAPSVSGINTRFGYFDFGRTFNNSVGVTLEHGSLDPGSSSTALYHDGGVSGGSNLLPFPLFADHLIDARFTYNGTILHESLTDAVTGLTFDKSYLVDIPSIVGSDTAYVGFTAASASAANGDQYFANLQYRGVPEPAMVSLLVLGSAALLRRPRRMIAAFLC